MSQSAPALVQSNAPVIGIVVGEASGDILGGGLIKALKTHYPDAHFVGVGGPKMIAEGFDSLFAQDRLAVMGLVEPLKRLPELIAIRRKLIRYFIQAKPLLVVGIDSPDFNLGLEMALKKAGITTAHYVSPSVWAWRQGRIKKIAKAVDLMLTLLPFEAQFYRENRVPVKFVGHPLADEIALQSDQGQALQQLGLPDKKQGEQIIALLPGSRSMEVERLGSVFFRAAKKLSEGTKNLRILVPSANSQRHQQLQSLIKSNLDGCQVQLIAGRSLEVMQAADAVLMASGTTTLEALLLKRPMVIAYIVAPLSYKLFKLLIKVPHIGLPNLLAGRTLVPEYIQEQASAEKLADALAQILRMSSPERAQLQASFHDIHLQLRKNASQSAAQALHQLIESKHVES